MTNPATIYEEWFVPAVFAPLAWEGGSCRA